MNETSAGKSDQKRRPRISLLNALLLMTIAAMSVALWRLNGELAPMRAELRQLRNETGRLYVDDETKIHAIRVATTDFDAWKYRIWLPEGRRYWLWNQRSRIPARGVPGPGSGGSIEPGEHVIEVVLRPEPDDKNRLKLAIVVDGNLYQTATVTERTVDWIDNDEVGGRQASWGGVTSEADRFAPNEPVVLLRYRAHEVVNIKRSDGGDVLSYQTKDIEGPTDGVMLWIAERNK